MNEHDFIEAGMIELYVLGLTDDDETHLVESHLRKNPGLKRQVAQMRSEMMQYARKQTVELSAIPAAPAKSIQPSVLLGMQSFLLLVCSC